MAGSDPRFPADQFRDAIRFAMTMGTPNKVADRATFRWIEERTYTSQDPAGRTYDWATPPAATVAIADLQLPCTVETPKSTTEDGTALGSFDPSKATVTLLDTEYDALLAHGAGRLPDQVIIGQTTYVVRFEGDPMGLFDVDTHQLHCETQEQRA